MDSLVTRAALAGLFFGLWPLFMNRSGLSGNVSSATFCLVSFLIVVPFASKDCSSFQQAKWLMIILAGVFGASGLLSFNGMLASATPQRVGQLFVVMVVVQVSVPAIYNIIMTGELTITKAVGFVAALVAAVLLVR